MRKSVVAFLLLVALVTTGQLFFPPRTASAAVQVITNTATNQFPNGIKFDFYFSSDSPPSDVRLQFRILPDGVNATVKGDCTQGRVINCSAVVGNIGQTYMVPGADIVYSWQVTDQAGGHFKTDDATTTYEDTRFDWQSIADGDLTLHYYYGDEATAKTVLSVAKETVDKFSKIENTSIDFPVKIWMYRTAQDMQPAVASRRGQGGNDTIVTLGEVGASDTALISTDEDYLDIVRHELTHVVTGAATRDHLVDIPVWLNEGLSTYAQQNLLPNESNALAIAIKNNTVMPITSLDATARGTANEVSLFYAESGSIVRFMIEKLGQPKFAQFLAALKDDTVSGALQTVYGFDRLGLENAWRADVGLPAYDPSAVTPTVTPSQSTPTPTATPSTAQSQNSNNTNNQNNNTSSASSKGSGGGGVSLVVVVLIGLIAAFVLLLAAAGILIVKGRRAAG